MVDIEHRSTGDATAPESTPQDASRNDEVPDRTPAAKAAQARCLAALEVSRPRPTTDEEREQIHHLQQELKQAGLVEEPHVASWLTERCARRYLRSHRHHYGPARDALRRSIQWRLHTRPESAQCQACERNPRAHTYRRVGYARTGEPVIFSVFAGGEDLVPRNNAEHLMVHIEQAVGSGARWPDRDPYPETYIWVLHFAGYGLRHMNPAVGRACLKMFSEHYPERLRMALIIDAPVVFRGLWLALRPFLEAQTQDRLVFMSGHVSAQVFPLLFPPELCAWFAREFREVHDTEALKRKDIWSEWSPARDADRQPLEALFPGEGKTSTEDKEQRT